MSRSTRPTPKLSWPFTGRVAELSAARAALERDAVVVVAGAAGLGKSRLARELVDEVASGETVGLVYASASSRDIPLGAFARWLSALPDYDGDVEAAPLVTALVRADQAVRRCGPRSVLLIDDAHMLDGVSATLVRQLAQDRALRLVMTVRSKESCPQAVTAIWKDGIGERVELESLDRDAGAALLEAALGAPVDAMALRRLHDTTRGNVLWLRHLVESERAAGRLALVHGRWVWDGMSSLSPALEQLINDRIGALSEGERHVLELVAVGEPVGLGMLVELASEDDVDRVAHRGLVIVAADGARSDVRLGHPLYGEATRGRLSVLRARRIRGELSRALQRTGGRRAGDELRRAVLDLNSDTPPDAALLVLAAQRAIDLTDMTLAERLLRAAIDDGGGFDSRLGLGFLLSWMLRPQEAEREFVLALAAAGSDQQRARAISAHAYLLIFFLDRADEARALMSRDGVDVEGVPYPETEALAAVLLIGAGDVVAGVAAATAVLERDGISALATTWASWSAAFGMVMAGAGGTRVRDVVTRGMDAARLTPETGPLLGNLGFAEINEAGSSGVLDDAVGRLAWVDGLPGPWAALWSALYRGRLALDAGQPATAVRLLETVAPLFPDGGGGWGSLIHAMLAQAHAAGGNAEGAQRSLEAAEDARLSDVRLADGEIELARAWLAASRGAPADAALIAVKLGDKSRAGGQRAVEVLARHAAVRFGDREQNRRLIQLADALGSPRARAASVHSAGWANRDAKVLLAAADQFEGCGLFLAAADASAHAYVVAREHGDGVVASHAARRAAALVDDYCEEAITPALALAQDRPSVRGRERDVAVLVAQGLTNREIADRLQVSVRTVESHIYRACSRLGLPNRAALGVVILPRP